MIPVLFFHHFSSDGIFMVSAYVELSGFLAGSFLVF